MSHKNKPAVSRFELAHYSQFCGKTIVRVELVEVDRGFDFLPTFTFADGTSAQAWRDPEMNGAGWLTLLDSEGNELLPTGLKTGDFEKKERKTI